jgi:LPXTG-motif cell wall-anchored protein
MRKLIVLLAIALGLGFTAPAFATVTTHSTHVISSPDDGAPPWARDTFDRVTSVTPTDDGFLIQFSDDGTFTTPGGVTGKLHGEGTFKVTGGTLKPGPFPASIDRTDVLVKDSFTGEWWKNFVTEGQTAGIVDWKWTYSTHCWKRGYSEFRIETPEGAKGEYPSKVCPAKPSHSHSASPSPSVSSAQPSSGAVTPSTSHTTVVGGPSLPVTGPSIGILAGIGGVVIIGGLVALWASRRRRATFEA